MLLMKIKNQIQIQYFQKLLARQTSETFLFYSPKLSSGQCSIINLETSDPPSEDPSVPGLLP